MGGCAIKTIALHEEKFRELLKRYNAGDISAAQGVVDIFATHVHKNIEASQGEFDYNIIEALVRDLVIKDLERGRYTKHIAHYSNNYLSSVKVTIKKWDIQGNSNVKDIEERLTARKEKSITNEQWAYEKVLSITNEKGDVQEIVNILYPITIENVSEYLRNYYHLWPNLTESEIEESLKDVLIDKIYAFYEEGMFPNEYYRWIIKTKRSLQCYFSSLNEKKDKSLIIEDIDEFSDVLVSDEDPLLYLVNQEQTEMMEKLLSNLKDRAKYVISQRFFYKTTYQVLAEELNVSVRRVQQIEKDALCKLKNIIEDKQSFRKYFNL